MCLTGSVIRPVFGVRNQREGEDQRAEHAPDVARRGILEDEAAEVHQRQRENIGEDERPAQRCGPPRDVSVEDDLGEDPADGPDHEQRRLQVVGGVVQELELFDRRDVR